MKHGLHVYEIGDHGALIVTVKKGKPTNVVNYSWDEGETWQTQMISFKDVLVHNIISEPDGSSQ